MSLPVSLKILVPGYRTRWAGNCRAMIDQLNALAPQLECGERDGGPWIKPKPDGYIFHGFWTAPDQAEIFDIIRRELDPAIERRYFRLLTDYVSRFVYPHMRPDLRLTGYIADQLFCFHGQHKDALLNDAFFGDTKLMQAFSPKPDDVVIDCGAFLGFGAMHMAERLTGSGKVIAVEADTHCQNLLVTNIETNGIGNVTPLRRAVWNEETELELQSGYAQANSLVSEVHSTTESYRVRTISIDQIARKFNLDRVDMISLTLNGAEIEALDGAEFVLNQFKPRIRLAGWYSRGGESISELTRRQLTRHGYTVHIGPRKAVAALPTE